MKKMAKLKKPTVTFQTEVKNDDEWNEILHRDGLTVVDIYCDWSGPCTAMVSTLKKIKMEFGGDVLNYVLARNDEITALKRFRGKSEPVWMFIQNGKLVNLIFGSHCPNLKKILIEEIKRVENNELPMYEISVDQRTPDEEVKFMEEETIKRMNDLQQRIKEEAEEKSMYEEYMQQMMIELSEETALIIFPWVFINENGSVKEKEMCPPYLELTSRILPNRFDIIEQNRIQLDENIIYNIFKESGITVTDDLIDGLTENKCLAMRLKGRLPPANWPVPYPHVCTEEGKKCPTRALNDVENFLQFILEDIPTRSNQGNYPQSFMDHYKLIVDFSEEQEEGEDIMNYPAVWFPTNARNKVHVFKTLYATYMDRAHPYEQPEKPLPLVAFKFNLSKLSLLSDYYQQYRDVTEYFGVFEHDDPRARRLASSPQDYLGKAIRQTGNEIILIVLRKINENIFLAFAGNSPMFIEENQMEVAGIIDNYFSESTVDFDSDIFSCGHFEETAEYYYNYEEYEDDDTFY